MHRLIEVTWHAIEQFRERFPEESGSSSSIRLMVAQEVEAALDSGCYSTRLPGWSREDGRRALGRRNGHERNRSIRFVWTENRQRVYLVDKHGSAVRVVTSIRPD